MWTRSRLGQPRDPEYVKSGVKKIPLGEMAVDWLGALPITILGTSTWGRSVLRRLFVKAAARLVPTVETWIAVTYARERRCGFPPKSTVA